MAHSGEARRERRLLSQFDAQTPATAITPSNTNRWREAETEGTAKDADAKPASDADKDAAKEATKNDEQAEGGEEEADAAQAARPRISPAEPFRSKRRPIACRLSRWC